MSQSDHTNKQPVKIVALATRAAGLSLADFAERWIEQHAPGTAYPGLIGYTINIAVPTDIQPAPAFDGMAEMVFDRYESFVAAADSEEGRRRAADAASFCSTLQMFVTRPHAIDID